MKNLDYVDIIVNKICDKCESDIVDCDDCPLNINYDFQALKIMELINSVTDNHRIEASPVSDDIINELARDMPIITPSAELTGKGDLIKLKDD